MTAPIYCRRIFHRFFHLACSLLLATLLTHLATRPTLAAGCQPADGELLIWAAYIDTWLPVGDPLQGTDETDEAIAVINLSQAPLDLNGCLLSDKGSHSARFPTYTLPPQAIAWAARDAEVFKTIFGFWPAFDYDTAPLSATEQANGVLKMSLTGSATGPLALSNGTETIKLQAQDGRLLDLLPYGKSNTFRDPLHWPQAGGVAPSAGYGPLINNIPRFSLFQIISRKLDGCTGLPVTETNTPADWATDPTDDLGGRRFFRPGQDLPRYALPLKVTEAVTKLKFLVSPDNSFPEFFAELSSATKSIKIGGYEYAHPDLIQLLIDKAAVLPVQILFDYQPVEGLDDEQKYLCQALANRGNGSGCTWINDSFTTTTSGPFGVTRGLIGRYRFHHAKYTVIDDKVVLVGTENPKRTSIPFETKPANGASGNRGVYIVTDAPTVVQHFVRLFATDNDLTNHFDVRAWSSTVLTDTPPANFALPPLGGADRTGYTIVKPQALALPAGVYELEVLQSPDNVLTTCTAPGQERGLLGMVARAGAGDWVLVAQNSEEQQWGTSSTPRPNPRLVAYLAAAQRGATVRVILDGNPLNQATCDYLNSQNITGGGSIACRKGNPTGGTYHIKEVAVCAGGQGFVNISSVNGTENSHKQNRETGLQVKSATAFQYMADLFATDWAKVGGAPLTIQCAGAAVSPTATAVILPTATATLTPNPTATPTPIPTIAVTATTTPAPTVTATPVRDDLTRIRGIGPTYASRLYVAGVYTFAHLARLTPAEIKAIVAPGRSGNFIDAEAWIAQAQALANSK